MYLEFAPDIDRERLFGVCIGIPEAPRELHEVAGHAYQTHPIREGKVYFCTTRAGGWRRSYVASNPDTLTKMVCRWGDEHPRAGEITSYVCGWYAQPSPEVHYRTAYERATTYVNVLFGMRYRFNSLLDWSDVRFFRQCDGEPTVYCSECDDLYTKSHDCFAEDEDIDFLFKSHSDCTSDCSYGAVYTGSASLWEVARLLESKKPCGMYYQDFSVKSGLGNCYGNYPSEMPYATHTPSMMAAP